MKPQEIIAELRSIRRQTGKLLSNLERQQIENLEIEIAGTEQEDFTSNVVGFETVLSYLAKSNPEALDLMPNPVHETIKEGKIIASWARGRGLPIIKIEACQHMRKRFPKAEYVNAYPTHLLVEYFG